MCNTFYVLPANYKECLTVGLPTVDSSQRRASLSGGRSQFSGLGRSSIDQAELASIAPDTFAGKAAAGFGCPAAALFKAFCKPRIKVGTEWVTKGQTCEQATMATGGIARAIFDRIFKWR